MRDGGREREGERTSEYAFSSLERKVAKSPEASWGELKITQNKTQ